MKRNELFRLHGDLAELLRTGKGIKLSYMLVRNVKKLETESKMLEELRKPTEKFQEYENKRMALCSRHARKDDKGAAMTLPGPGGRSEFDIADRPVFDKEISELRAEYKDELAALTARELEFNKFFAEESDIVLYTLKYSVLVVEQEQLPVADRLTAAQLLKLWPVIEDDADVSAEEAVADPAAKLGFRKITE